jgi:hypothetical protein
MNIRGIVNSGVPFSVVDGGPSQQMAFEYPNDTYSVLPQSSALLQSAFPTLMLYEQGEMLTRAACDPIASVSGAINRIAYSMAFQIRFRTYGNYEHLLYANIRLRHNGSHHADVDRSKVHMC